MSSRSDTDALKQFNNRCKNYYDELTERRQARPYQKFAREKEKNIGIK